MSEIRIAEARNPVRRYLLLNLPTALEKPSIKRCAEVANLKMSAYAKVCLLDGSREASRLGSRLTLRRQCVLCGEMNIIKSYR